MWECKNYQSILRAIKAARDAGTDVYYHFVGEGYYLETLKKLAQELSIDDLVTFHGRINDKSKLINLYRSANFSCLLSYSEGLPLAVLEAMANGLPVIIADLPYANDLISPSQQAGFRIPADDYILASEKMISWAKNPELHYKMAKHAYKKSLRFSIEEQVKEFSELAHDIKN